MTRTIIITIVAFLAAVKLISAEVSTSINNNEISEAMTIPPLNFIVGEKITYDVKLWKMSQAMGFNTGTVIFEVDRGTIDHKDYFVFRGIAEGNCFGYELRIDLESYIDSQSLLPVLFTSIQSGSEQREKKLAFSNKKIEYLKMKHCKAGNGCQEDSHFISNNGISAHCGGCKDKAHYIWSLRLTHENNSPTYDLLSALFLARQFPLKIGGNGENIRLVDDRDIWDMNISAIGEEIVETPIGKFDTISLRLQARPLNGHASSQDTFRGLFGLKGDISLWVDKKTRIPVRVRGTYPFIFEAQIEVILKSIEGRSVN